MKKLIVNAALGVMALNFALSSSVLACPSKADPQMQKCTEVQMSAAPIGHKCISSRGGVFQRVQFRKFGTGIKDPNGLIWREEVGSSGPRFADEECQSLGGRLPTAMEFESAEILGFRETMYGFDNVFWTSTPSGSSAFEVFVGSRGALSFSPSFLTVSAYRCVRKK